MNAAAGSTSVVSCLSLQKWASLCSLPYAGSDWSMEVRQKLLLVVYELLRGRALFRRFQKGIDTHIQLQKKFLLLSCHSETSTCHFMTPPRPVVHSNGLCYSRKQARTWCDALPILAEMLSAPAPVSDMPTTLMGSNMKIQRNVFLLMKYTLRPCAQKRKIQRNF
jgi:hypothetical protein